jgi:uncharacterized protein DUF6221
MRYADGMTIAEFLAARLDEKERFALAACGREYGHGAVQPEHWRWECAEDDTPLDVEQAIASNDEILHHGDHYRVILWSTEQYPALSGIGPLPHKIVDSVVTPQAARFLAYRDPARALREVAAGRKILAEYIAVLKLIELTDSDRSALSYREWVLRHLIAVDSDHPDYDPAWLSAPWLSPPPRSRPGTGPGLA